MLVHPQEIVSGYTQPIYDWILAHSHELLIILVIVICLRILSKIGKRIKRRRYLKEKPGSTNEWFDWNKFKEWESDVKKENNKK